MVLGHAQMARAAADQLEQEVAQLRLRWLQAETSEQLVEIESGYRAAIKRARRGQRETAYPGFRKILDDATQRLALMLAQQGRDEETAAVLGKRYSARLHPAVLNYSLEPPLPESNGGVDASSAPCIVLDGALATGTLSRLDEAFLDPSADYWVAHDYSVEPPSPYFSYVTEITALASTGSALFSLIKAALTAVELRWGKERASAPRFAELWAHNRPHASGHQMHFDSDDEGRDGVRNPVASCVLYLTETGGPTVITEQRLADTELAPTGWSVLPKRNRLVVFDGTLLHGVVPGKGCAPNARRVTVMIALWHDVAVRKGPGPGSCRPLPDSVHPPQWFETLCGRSNDEANIVGSERCIGTPRFLDGIWIDVKSGAAWPRGVPMPPYEKAFQGF